jgi:hypothetical protein
MQVDLMTDVCDDGRALDVIRFNETLDERISLLLRQCHQAMWTCSLPERWPEQTGSVYRVSRCREQCWYVQVYQVKVVLNHVVLESLSWQCAIAHTLAEFVMRVVVPRWLYIVPFE